MLVSTKQSNLNFYFNYTDLTGFFAPLDHVHIVIIIPPRVAVADVIGFIKAKTAQLMKAKFPFLNNCRFR